MDKHIKNSIHLHRQTTEGKMPEWSNGPHSKCGERVTVPWVRIPVFPLNQANNKQQVSQILEFVRLVLFSYIYSARHY